MATETQIVNFALRRLGCEPVGSISDDNKRAKVMNDLYDMARQSALGSYPWKFANTRALLTDNGNTPAFEYSYEFDLPADYLKAVREYNDTEFVREGDVLLCDSDELRLLYTQDIADETLFSAVFAKYMALVLAVDGSYALVQDKKLKTDIEAEMMRILDDARFNDSTESKAEDYEINDFTDVRL